ncbi:unnamed protein product [Lactuca saligna]|uniref:Dof zinc finger protein n=1 Tax=Lactuca saligna TaxID=75948 RepID=A0AA35VIH3_LACSI|nr:unnamed protein product [Lactuca saligna]
MQDIHSFESSGGGGALFAGGGDRRYRHHHQDLKCPRCDSSNTKFCYYNNYNLSQPRHFCKSCRRYWTKGGVLRNVPVGGGIRKAKRSSKPKSKLSIPCSDAVAAERKSSNSENSSSASSTPNRTATTTTSITTTDASGSNSTNSTPAMMLNFNESSRGFFNIPQSSTPITTFDPVMVNQPSAGNMSPEIGAFTNMMTSSMDQLSGIPSFQLQQKNTEDVVGNDNCNQIQWTVETTGFMDQVTDIELSIYGSRRNNGGIAGIENWQHSTDEGLFDLTGNLDQSYWNQNHWKDDDHNQYHLNYIP